MKGKFPCPECGERTNQLHSSSTFVIDKGIIRGKHCPNGHKFVTIELPLNMETLSWEEVMSRIG